MFSIRSTLTCAIAAATLTWSGLATQAGHASNASNAARCDTDFQTDVRPFLEQHCFACHGARKQKGGFRIDELSVDFSGEPSVDQWLEVIEKLGTGEMPPEGRPDPPTPEDSGRIAEWLAARIEEGRAARMARRERVSFHRLTREEYGHTIYDLLGVQFDVADAAGLIEDDSWRGFERIGTVLSLSPSHVEKYFAAAEAILAEAYPEATPKPSLVRYSAVDLVGGPKTFGNERYERLRAEGRTDQIRIDLWPGQQVRVQPVGGWNRHSGQYRFRAQLSGLRSRSGRAPHLTVHAATIDRLLFERDIVTAEGEPVIIEFEAHLPVGAHEFQIVNEVPGPAILTRLGRSDSRPFFSLAEGRIPWQLELKDEDDIPVHPVLILDWMEWEGPLATDASTDREQYMPDAAEASSVDVDLAEVRACLASFTERAFRRPLRPGEIDPFLQVVESELAAGADLRSSVKTSMLAVLCSRGILYLQEGAADHQARLLNAWELAARLSYFLWSTMPDDELSVLARSGELHLPEVLSSQLARMLADPRSERFAESFTRQWLQLDRVGMFTPNVELYPDYDKQLERSMVRETTAFFGEVLARNLSLEQFLSSDWTMLNPRLALHYGIPGIIEDRFRRVPLEPGHHRGGILTHASVLSLTSDGTRHRPVHRGVWLSESILGQFPAPPPASVVPIEPTPIDAAKATVRMQLDAHKSNPACFACHRKIDPLGFAFDNYDAIGRWRTTEHVPTGTGENPRVDASGILPDGRSFSNAADFQTLLTDDLDRFAAAFVEKLATYALRRSMSADDRGELERIAERSATGGHRLQDVLEALVLSELFANR